MTYEEEKKFRKNCETMRRIIRLMRDDNLRRLMNEFPDMYPDYLLRIANDMVAHELKEAGLI